MKTLPEGTPIEIWFQDEARVGQKNGIVYQWAPRGTRPRQPKDQRYENAYIFGAICPQRGVGAALVLPYADAQSTTLHLAEISRTVAPGAHGIVVLDRAGWHIAHDVGIPDNLSLILLPSRSPELNPVENIWQYLRQTWLSNRVFETYDDILDASCQAWSRLIERPWKIMTIGLRTWAAIDQP